MRSISYTVVLWWKSNSQSQGSLPQYYPFKANSSCFNLFRMRQDGCGFRGSWTPKEEGQDVLANLHFIRWYNISPSSCLNVPRRMISLPQSPSWTCASHFIWKVWKETHFSFCPLPSNKCDVTMNIDSDHRYYFMIIKNIILNIAR